MSEIVKNKIEQELTHEGVTMVCLLIEYPTVSGLTKGAEKRINVFYKHHANKLLRDIKKRVLPAAIAEYTLSLEKSVPFKPYEVTLHYTVTFDVGDVLSLYRELYTRFGSRRSTRRFGDTWSISAGWFLDLRSFFPQDTKYRKILTKNAIQAADKQEKAGTHRYYDSFARLIRKHFSPDRFYITENGVTIFYDELTIAPAAEGVAVFPYFS